MASTFPLTGKPALERGVFTLPVALWLVWGYFITRFAVGKPSLLLLIAAMAIVVVRSIQNHRVQPVVFWTPILLGFSAAVIGSISVSDGAVTNYWIFVILAFLVHSLGYSLFLPLRPRQIVPLTIAFVLSVVPFILYPDLSLLGYQPNDGAVELAKQLSKVVQFEVESRNRAYFFHSGELGAFAACLFVLLSQTCKYAGRRIWFDWATAGEFLLYISLASVIYATNSTTAYIVVAFAFFARMRSTWWLAPLPAFIVFAQFTTQIYFPREVATFLERGSLMWRYEMAAIVKPGLPFFTFSPEKINDQANWMHSIFLDIATLYGLIPLFSLLAIQLLLPAFRQYRNMAYGWSCLFLVVAAIMPVGSSAIYILLALALGYAERIAIESRASLQRV